MKGALLNSCVALTALASCAGAASVDQPQRRWNQNLVNADELMAKIKLKDLMAGAQKLQSFADKYPAKNRVFGEAAHKDTVDWLYNELKALRYYDVKKEEQKQLWSRSEATLTAGDKKVDVRAMTYSPSGTVSGDFSVVKNLGCKAEDYAGVSGKIALISRGECSFAEKALAAGSSKAIGAVVYNNVPGELGGTLGGADDRYVPTVGISQADGQDIISRVGSGSVSGHLWVDTKMENRTTWNVIAQTKGGDSHNVVMLGSHSDSVDAGPGINDNGSGSIGILAIAKALTQFKVKNAVRFGWWTAEEFGLLGSEYYVANLPEKEIAKLRLYLNFDMIASPNYVNGIYDGDGSTYNTTGPAGSAEIEHLFQKFFDDQGLPHQPTEFDGRSDYDAFIQKKIPAGGIFTGAEKVKSAKEAKLYGGEAGVPYDVNYHAKGDDVKNLNKNAFLVNTRGAAYAIAEYASSLRGFPPREKSTKRDEVRPWRGHNGDCTHRDCTW
ncbi:Leucyl aminopeptidase yscIV [Myotisia sp. PD_48]|nr:Leucyl aminopeptidase yscIV [Myotisia sp. PD_48]